VDERKLERARSFGSVADEYERARPDYPVDGVAWLAGTEPRRVVDLGAGTGKLTRQLIALGHEVVAVEPSLEMLGRLLAAVPQAEALSGTAESIPLPDAAADVVVAAQAFHWFDAPVALAEIARVLRPGGRLGLIWNTRDESVAWVAELSRAIEAEPDAKDDDDFPGNVIDSSGLYDPLERATFPHAHHVDRDSLLDLVRSRSYVATLGDDERAAVLAEVVRLYEAVAEPDGVLLPYVTEVFRTRLAG
jgi:SAM-dependent methyltransferase